MSQIGPSDPDKHRYVKLELFNKSIEHLHIDLKTTVALFIHYTTSREKFCRLKKKKGKPKCKATKNLKIHLTGLETIILREICK